MSEGNPRTTWRTLHEAIAFPYGKVLAEHVSDRRITSGVQMKRNQRTAQAAATAPHTASTAMPNQSTDSVIA
ncbi:hypothetical protein MCNF_25290 [Mycolicibacterium confluentis]|uniref:Uncharacterized protein n=1 Tax=Mycolicibacterium confluentis TaxID=28047 RepID=A0A7I7XXQ5_9MYCO|nr:hypothetical protein MCNF_25290 [Mycolicibacterium confluentis]